MGNRMNKCVMQMALDDILEDMKSSGIEMKSFYGENGKLHIDVWVYGVGRMANSKKIKKLNAQLGIKNINFTKKAMTRK